MKVNLPINGANLHLHSRGNVVRIDVDFMPIQQPNFTDFLDENFELRRAHSDEESNTGYYSLYIEDAKFNSLVFLITKGAEANIDLKNPTQHIYTGTKLQEHGPA